MPLPQDYDAAQKFKSDQLTRQLDAAKTKQKPYTHQTHPAVRYHHIKAPNGIKVLSKADEDERTPASEGWVDNPSKFPPSPVRVLSTEEKLEVLEKMMALLETVATPEDEDALVTLERIINERDQHAHKLAANAHLFQPSIAGGEEYVPERLEPAPPQPVQAKKAK